MMLVEAKVSDTRPDRNLIYFKNALEVDLAFQVVLESNSVRQVAPGVFVLDLASFMTLLV